MPTLTLIIVLTAFGLGYMLGNRQNGSRSVDFGSKAMHQQSVEAVKERTQKRKSRVLDKAVESGRITNDDVEELFCISDSTARSYLNELEAEGKLVQHGDSGRGVYYTPTK